LRGLDVVPRQVLIEVLIAEVSLGDELTLGVEWALAAKSRKDALSRITGDSPPPNANADDKQQTPAPGVFDVGQALGLRSTVAPLPSGGFFGIVSDNRNFAATLNAAADRNKLKILSAPHLMTADNHEAHILVGREVPIVTTQTTNPGVEVSGTSSVLQNIQYRDTGVIMSVLPQVNSAGLVNMQIRQEVSEIEDRTITGIASPTFLTREAETTVVVQSGQTIVIGGIIDDHVTRTRTGVPFLMDVPVLGRAFRLEHQFTTRVELIVLLTPHVIRDRQESEVATDAFRGRLRGLRADFDRLEREGADYGDRGAR
jgi:general secretion pathway protein D